MIFLKITENFKGNVDLHVPVELTRLDCIKKIFLGHFQENFSFVIIMKHNSRPSNRYLVIFKKPVLPLQEQKLTDLEHVEKNPKRKK